MKPVSRVLPWLAAILAVSYLAGMFYAGALPEYAQFNAFEAAGLLREPPESVTRVELQRAAQHWIVRRAGGQWRDARDQALPPRRAAQLTEAVRFMFSAAPVRTLSETGVASAELVQFGLAPARLSVTLANASGTLLQFDLGGSNPDGVLRYVRATGQPGIVLMSGFVGQAWDEVVTGLAGAPVPQADPP
jgi:hypothetical protein